MQLSVIRFTEPLNTLEVAMHAASRRVGLRTHSMNQQRARSHRGLPLASSSFNGSSQRVAPSTQVPQSHPFMAHENRRPSG